MKKSFITMFLLAGTFAAFSQTFTVVATDLKTPLGLTVDAANNLWVVETGSGNNDSRVSILKADGTVVPVVEGLPSTFDTMLHEIKGPSHVLALPFNQIALLSGQGEDTLSGNVLFYDLNGFTPGTSPAKAATATSNRIDVTGFLHLQGFMESNPFSAAIEGINTMYVADAAANAVVKFTLPAAAAVVATLPDFPNPTPVGPPVINQVPTRILAKPGGGYYLATLTGFPFIEGAATIYNMASDGTLTPFKSGMSLITDLAIDPVSGDLFALQFGTFAFAPMPGYQPGTAKISRIKADGTVTVVAENFGPAAGLALDQQGNAYVSETFAGRVLKFAGLTTGTHPLNEPTLSLNLTPNPSTDFVTVDFPGHNGEKSTVSVLNTEGKIVLSQTFTDAKVDLRGLAAGIYIVQITTEKGAVGAARLVKE